MSKTRRKIVALGTALSLAFVLVAALLPVTVKAMEFPDVTTSQYGLFDDGSINNSVNMGTGGQVVRIDKPATADDITVDAASKTVTFTNLSTSGIDLDVTEAGWTFVFKGTNSLSSRMTSEFQPVTIKLDAGAKLTVATADGAEGLSGQYILGSDTECTADLSAMVMGVKNVTFSGPQTAPENPDSGTVTPSDNSSASTDSTATTPTTTTTSAAASNTATTTKATAPKTADAMPFMAVALVVAGATAIGVIAIRRKNS